MINSVVLHFTDGVIRKGTTEDFFPNKPSFHFKDVEHTNVQVIPIIALKAVFFVKTFEGKPEYDERHDVDRAGFGRKIRITYKDGEIQDGYTQGYSPDRQGFFVFPADPESNNDRIFVVSGATDTIEFV
jgi:hypothetical protein